MSDPYLGQIEVFSFGVIPKGWLPCAGQLLPINQYSALFSLLGTTYGGNGVTTFALPDLRGRVPIGQGNGSGLSPRPLGSTGGEAAHTLTVNETPAHVHALTAIANPNRTQNTDAPDNTMILSNATGINSNGDNLVFNIYGQPVSMVATSPASIGIAGGQPHANMMPGLVLNACIATVGIFPSRN